MDKFKGFVKLTEEQYKILSEQGSITVKGQTFTYDPNNTLYMTKDDESGQIKLLNTNLSNQEIDGQNLDAWVDGDANGIIFEKVEVWDDELGETTNVYTPLIRNPEQVRLNSQTDDNHQAKIELRKTNSVFLQTQSSEYSEDYSEGDWKFATIDLQPGTVEISSSVNNYTPDEVLGDHFNSITLNTNGIAIRHATASGEEIDGKLTYNGKQIATLDDLAGLDVSIDETTITKNEQSQIQSVALKASDGSIITAEQLLELYNNRPTIKIITGEA